MKKLTTYDCDENICCNLTMALPECVTFTGSQLMAIVKPRVSGFDEDYEDLWSFTTYGSYSLDVQGIKAFARWLTGCLTSKTAGIHICNSIGQELAYCSMKDRRCHLTLKNGYDIFFTA